MTTILNPLQVAALNELHTVDTQDGFPALHYRPSQSRDQEDTTMSAAIDAEGVTEKAAHLRDHGWFLDASDPTCWRHPRLPALPPISLNAAIELQREATIDEAEQGHNPAGPRRVH